MGEVRKDHLLQLMGLLGDGCSHYGVPVAVQGHPPAADRIDEWFSMLSVQQGALP